MSAQDYEDGDFSVDVLDHEPLTVVIEADTLSETDGPNATTATHARSRSESGTATAPWPSPTTVI